MPDKKRPPATPKPRASKATQGADGKPTVKRAPPRKPRRAPAVAPTPEVEGRPLSIVMVSSEAHPFAKTGGLAEVVGSLSDALARLGHTVTLVLPRYRRIDITGTTAHQTSLRMGFREQDVTFRTRPIGERVTAAFVDVPELFDRDELYGIGNDDYPDNASRFAVLSRAALAFVRLTGARPSVIHAHDWQAGLVPVYQKMHLPTDAIVGGVPVVFTIHNLAFQGLFPPTVIPSIGLGWDALNVQALEYWGQVSFLKGGVNFSETITTVSPTYAREIVQPDLGFGFEGVLARRSDDLVGILNGIDTDRWNPAADPYVPTRFDASNLAGKREAKRALLQEAGLPDGTAALARPVIGLISRLTDQKGFDLVAAAAAELMTLDASWVMLGSGDPAYEEMWRDMAARNPQTVSATIGFDERLAHVIEAGADMFLMPSRFEPCGLNQMYSMRYGTVPIVRATGGLRDTVEEVDASGRGTGFTFTDYTAAALIQAVRRALDAYRNRTAWKKIQQAGMEQDHSWDASAREYVKVYRGAEGRKV